MYGVHVCAGVGVRLIIDMQREYLTRFFPWAKCLYCSIHTLVLQDLRRGNIYVVCRLLEVPGTDLYILRTLYELHRKIDPAYDLQYVNTTRSTSLSLNTFAVDPKSSTAMKLPSRDHQQKDNTISTFPPNSQYSTVINTPKSI